MSKNTKNKDEDKGSSKDLIDKPKVDPPMNPKEENRSKKTERKEKRLVKRRREVESDQSAEQGKHSFDGESHNPEKRKRKDRKSKYHRGDSAKVVEPQLEKEECNGKESPRHSFPTNPLDHCETPLQAYRDLQAFLLALCQLKRLTPSTLRIWDPYFCDGKVKEHLHQLGFTNVRNENRDFYQRIQDHDLPDCDLLLTNPPYSDNHIDKLMQFCKSQSQPYVLLMPNWVARKKDYALKGQPHFFLSPVNAYMYIMPSWAEERQDHVGEDGQTRPYFSSWYIGGVRKPLSDQFHDEMDCVAKNQSWVVAKTIKGLKWKIQKKSHR
jgi:hypothetical protein